MTAAPVPDAEAGAQEVLAGRRSLLEAFAATWPSTLRLPVVNEGEAVRTVGHPLVGELEALLNGEPASLPYFRNRSRDSKTVYWVTVAPTADALQRGIAMLRAWVLPSFGWEDPERPFAVPGEEQGPLVPHLLAVSPAGYFRWRTTSEYCDTVIDRLGRMRRVLAQRPVYLQERVPSLFELRQQFSVALLVGNRDAAAAVIRTIDHHRLDSALNTQLMRVRMWDQFDEFAAIVRDPELDRVLQVRLPQAIRIAIVRAFHAVYLEEPEAAGDVTRAVEVYAASVGPVVNALLPFCRPSDGTDVARCLAYAAWQASDESAASGLLSTADPFVRPLLEALGAKPRSAVETVDDAQAALRAALERSDLRAIQSAAPLLLPASRPGIQGAHVDSAAEGRVDVAAVAELVRETLEVLPNAALEAQLEAATRAETGERLPAPSLPQTWVAFLGCLRARDWRSSRRFLALDNAERPSAESLTPEDLEAAVATLEELLTSDIARDDPYGRQTLDACLLAFVEDFVRDAAFPRQEFAVLYLHLLRLWSGRWRGSTQLTYAHVLLRLASAVLENVGAEQREVAELLAGWWNARKVPALLPYLLEAISLLTSLTSEDAAVQSLWVDGVDFARRDPDGLAPGERQLWRSVGLRTGFGEDTVEEQLGPPPRDGLPDPVVDAHLKKVAIVSLHERAAEEARTLIRARTGADVIIVAERVAGAGSKSAQSADVILLVWAASKHAVTRAFDRVRDRVEYVQGTGPGSIVLALERWAIKRRDEAQGGLAARRG